MFKNCQKGATMIEIIGVMGVIAMITIGLFSTVSKVFDRYHQTAVITQIRDLQKNIRMRYATATNYNGLNQAGVIADLIEDKVIPTDMAFDDKIINTYGGDVLLSGANHEYKITFSNLKKNGCIDLLMMDWSIGNTSDLVKLKVDGKTYSWTSGGTSQLPVSAKEAISRCKDKQSQNAIEWTFQ